MTHGGYGPTYYNTGKVKYGFFDDYGVEVGLTCHLIETSEDLFSFKSKGEDDEGDDLDLSAIWLSHYKNFKKWRDNSKFKDSSDQHINFTIQNELRNGEWLWVGHPVITEHFFRDIAKGHFKNSNSILFNDACESLKGDEESNPYRLAHEFFKRNLGTYLGYTDTDITGFPAGLRFYLYLAAGKSVEMAYLSLPECYREEIEENFRMEGAEIDKKVYGAQLLILPDNNQVKRLFLFPTKTQELNQQAVMNQYNETGLVTIYGSTLYNVYFDESGDFTTKVSTGFIIGENPNQLSGQESENLIDLGNGYHQFCATIRNLAPKTTYYYCAYSYDGMHYNYGDTLSFYIEDYPELTLSANTITLSALTSSSVDITSGSGSYSISENTAPDVVTASISESRITLEALTAGTAIITVKDNKSGETATIEVTVSVHESSIQTETFTVNGVSFKMVAVEGGTFMMGAPSTDNDAKDYEKPQHQVTLDSYAIGETEVTQELWKAVMGSNPSYFGGSNQCPVEQVSWYDCRTFINKLNKLTGKKFRLPTEAEWEFAARGGKNSQCYTYSGSNTPNDVAWYDVNSENRTHPVATKAANELGLYDMSGNVWEWCQDFYGDFSTNSQMNPTGPDTGTDLVLRSGSWNFPNFFCRSWHRNHDTPDHKASHLGLRLALSDSDIHNQCPARIVGVELTSTEYHRDKTYPNEMFFTVEAELDDLNDVEEWGVYFDDRPGKLLFPFETVDNSQTIGLYYNGKEGLMKVDIYSYVAQLEDEVGTYVKKRDKSTGKLITIYGDKYSFLLRYDNKPSMIISNPVITNTEFTGYDEDGEKKYKTTITYQYELNGAFWISYVNSGVSGGTWFFDETNDFLWYPEKDGSGEAIWIATYSCKGETINHTNWRILHLRNNQTVNSNYVNFTGDETITNAWVSSTPQFAPIGGQGNQLKTAGATSRCVMSHFISDEMGKGTFIPKKTKKEFPYKGGVIGIYHH